MDSTKNETKLLKEKLFSTAKHGAKTISEDEMKKIEKFGEKYKDFLNASKTERESVVFAINKAKEAGFTEFDKSKKYKPGDKFYIVNRGHALALVVMGKQGTKQGVKLAISHVDAPRLDLKPNPVFETNELAMFKSHYYGGIKKYQWTTIPLSLHGRIVKKDGSYVDVNLGEDENEPCFCVTDLLPHLAREQMNKKMCEAIMGEDLNILIGSMPFKNDEESELVKLNILKLLNDKYGIVEDDLISSD